MQSCVIEYAAKVVMQFVLIGDIQSRISLDHTFGTMFSLVVKGLCWIAEVPGLSLVVGENTPLKNRGVRTPKQSNKDPKGAVTVEGSPLSTSIQASQCSVPGYDLQTPWCRALQCSTSSNPKLVQYCFRLGFRTTLLGFSKR